MGLSFGTLHAVLETILGREIKRRLRIYHGNTQGRPVTRIDFDVACYWIEFMDGSASEYVILYNLHSHDIHDDNYMFGIWNIPTKFDPK